jgi:hypothetical protein
VIKKYQNRYEDYLNHANKEFSRNVPQIRKLFEDAGLKDSRTSRMEDAGLGMAKTYTLSIYDNIAVIDPDIIPRVHQKFEESIGIYRRRMFDSINPLFWLEVVYKLPENIFKQFGVSPSNNIVKVFQIIYWLASLIFMALEISDVTIVFNTRE